LAFGDAAFHRERIAKMVVDGAAVPEQSSVTVGANGHP